MLEVTDYDVLATALICFVAFGAAALLGSRLGLKPWVSAAFAASALILSVARYRVELSSPADAFGYYVESLLGGKFEIGTGFMPFITSALTRSMGLGFLPTMMFFALFGLLAMQICYAIFLRAAGNRVPAFWHLLFLSTVVPSLGFWGSGIAKDAIVLLGLSIFCLGAMGDRARLPMIIAGIAIVVVIRPHVGLFMMFGGVGGYIVAPDTSGRDRVIILALAAGASAILVPLTIGYLGLNNLDSIDQVGIQIDTLTTGYEGTGSYVELSSLPIPLQIVSYLFRPFPWESVSFSQLAAALQNMLLLVAIGLTAPAFVRQRRTWRTMRIAPLLCYVVPTLILLSMTTANLGVAARQKWMVLVPLFLLTFQAVAIERRTRPASGLRVRRKTVTTAIQERG